VLGCFQHVAVTVDTDALDGTPEPTARIYYNGFEATDPNATTILSDFNADPSTASMYVGKTKNGVYPLQGHVDEVMIFYDVLSEQQIRDAAGILQPAPAPPELPFPIPRLNFAPYVDGGPPQCVPAEKSWALLNTVAPYTEWVRTFSARSGLELIPLMARELDLGVAMGVFLNEDNVNNQIQIDNLILKASEGAVDIAVVGNEILLDEKLILYPLCSSADDEVANLICYVQQVRDDLVAAGLGDVLVTTVEPFNMLFDEEGNALHADLIEALDVVFVNIYPFHEGIHINDALEGLAASYQAAVDGVSDLGDAKPVYISETGWPSFGKPEENPKGDAVASFRNAWRYLRETTGWSNREGVPVFFFEAFDEDWKAPPEYARHWGVWNADGEPKFVLPVPALSVAGLICVGFAVAVAGALLMRRRGNS